MSDLKINNITDRTGGSGPVIAGVSTVSTTGAFVVPVGATEFRGGRGRGVLGGNDNTMEYITIATTGNATDFGDLTVVRGLLAGMSSPTRGVFAGGSQPTTMNTIDYVTIATTGNASDFGDMVVAASGIYGCSDSHGGLG